MFYSFKHTVLVGNVVGNIDISTLDRKEKIKIDHKLEKQGEFLMKGAVDKVAECMKISKVTIYSYIDELRSK